MTKLKTVHQTKEETPVLDPSKDQRMASDPGFNVWVGASAGTGKTKVLVDRILRLLLPSPHHAPGTPANRILCLTFTKAAASEMAMRISTILADWSVQPDETVAKDIQNRIGYIPTKLQLKEARQLFASVIDTPGGMKIMTIHAFCQSVLSRFPLEAGLTPNSATLDERQATELLTQARNKVLSRAHNELESDLGKAFYNIATVQNESQFMDALHSLCSERLQVEKCLLPYKDSIKLLHSALKKILDIPEDVLDIHQLLSRACTSQSFDKLSLKNAALSMLESKNKSDKDSAAKILLWIEKERDDRVLHLSEYYKLFLTKRGDIKKRLITKAVPNYDHHKNILDIEAARLLKLEDNKRAFQCAGYTYDLLFIGHSILLEFQKIKSSQASLDYDDLISYTNALLTENRLQTQWVMYKLDEGIDHILIDEAQDTNPEQWDIIKALADEFYCGKGASEFFRTIFTVGDEKQSIYSFQRASPKHFDKTRKYFSDQISANIWRDISLNTSFRSTKSVLRLVDEVFVNNAIGSGLGKESIKHISYRDGQSGLAEIWPIFETPIQDSEIPWSPPLNVKDSRSGQVQLAEFIGDKIKGWIDTKEILESQNRPIEPKDIMILVRTRTNFVNRLVRALKRRNIPVSGLDRMVLSHQIAVQDLLALAQFSLLPSDDLTLACILKSPFIGWSEQQLYDLAINRKGSLWGELKTSDAHIEVSWLKQLIEAGGKDHAFEFFSRILQEPCPSDTNGSGMRAICSRLGSDALDPVEEFLNATLSYESNNIPTLQGFLTWQQSSEITIKRELEEAGTHVRIMTVHGAKGLQAPIVILPDTTRVSTSRKTSRFIWPDKSGLDLPIWSPNATFDTIIYNNAKAQLEEELDAEYRRLLYVALTRAEDRLYISGFRGKTAPIEHCWYNYISAAFERMPDAISVAIGGGINGKRITNPQKDKVQSTLKDSSVNETLIPEPSWLRQPPKAEPSPPRPLVPSRSEDVDPSAHSPLSRTDQHRFKRGNLTHKLLQILPDIPQEQRYLAAKAFVAQPGHELKEPIQDSIIKETLSILNHPEYAVLFGESSMAEVPITGLINNKILSGQIDRLLIREKDVWIVDYKTNRPPPQDTHHIPRQYLKQMVAYRDTVDKIYPEKMIRTFLLWTDGPILMEVTSNL